MKYDVGTLVKFRKGAFDHRTCQDLEGQFGIILENVSTSKKCNKRYKFWKIFVQESLSEGVYERGLHFEKALGQ
jgi:hypothetical protein